MAEIAHSPLGASSMDRWSQCPGSVRLSKGIESTPSKYAEEGSLAHDLAAQWLKKKKKPEFPNQEMEETVKVYVDCFINNKPSSFVIEHKFDLSSIHPGCFGTADYVEYYEASKKLIVADFKYGAGIFVSPFNNPQLLYYGLGALLKYPAEMIEMMIVQPRYETTDGPIRSYEIPAIDLLDFSVELSDFAKATEDENAPLIPGEYCRFCPAAMKCPELQSKTQALAKVEFKKGLSYDPLKLKEALDSRPFIEAYLKNLDEFAYKEAIEGRCPPGYKLVDKKPQRKWKDEEMAEKALIEWGYKKKQIYEEPGLRSPAQMEKFIPPAKLEELIQKKSSGTVLAPISDKREEVKITAADEFRL